MELLLVAGVIILFFLVSTLSGRVSRLEAQVKSLAAGLVPRPTVVQEPPTAQGQMEVTQTRVAATSLAPTVSQPTPDATNSFIEWLKVDWLLKLGAMLILIAFGWLVTYAFLNNWIGPMGRIFLGVVAGTLILLFGSWRIRRYPKQGDVFLVLGSTTILLTLFAAREIYNFFTPASALGVMLLSTAFVAVLSVVYGRKGLAVFSLVLSYGAPLLTNTPQPDNLGLFTYLFVVTLGAIWIVLLTGWGELTLVSLISVALYSLPHLILWGTDPDKSVLLVFAYAFTAVFFITNVASFIRRPALNMAPDIFTAAGSGLFLLLWVKAAAPVEWQVLILVVWTIVFVIGAFLTYTATGKREPFYVYAGVGVALLAAATAIQLSGASLTIAYTIETAVVSLVCFAVMRDLNVAKTTSLLFIGPALLSVQSLMSSEWRSAPINKDFFVLLILGGTLLFLGSFYRGVAQKLGTKAYELYAPLFIAGSFYLYALLWLFLGAVFIDNPDFATMLSLVVYTIVGLICYIYGNWNSVRGMLLYGGTLLGFVVLRLMLVDVWKMELTGRIITFFLIGALLISTAFVGRKKKVQAGAELSPSPIPPVPPPPPAAPPPPPPLA